MAETTTKAKTKKSTPRKKATDNPVYKKIKQENEKFSSAIGQIMAQFRGFTLPDEDGDRKMRVYFPSPHVESEVNQTYSKTYGRLLQDEDYLPELQIMEMMKKRGIWSDEKDKEIEFQNEKLARLRNVIFLQGEEGMTPAEMDKVAKEYEETDKKMRALVDLRASFTANSIETRAYETKIKDQVWQCVKQIVGEEEKPLWANLDEIDEEKNRVLLYRVINECVSFWQGVPSDFLEDLPESPDGESDTP